MVIMSIPARIYSLCEDVQLLPALLVKRGTALPLRRAHHRRLTRQCLGWAALALVRAHPRTALSQGQS